jgi:gas vesicle protein
LTRINIGEQSLREPNSKYDEAIIEKENEVYNAYHDKEKNLSENLNKILDTVRSTLTMPPEYSALKQKYFENGTIYGKLKPIDPLKEEYKEQIDREWVDDYQDDLDEINDKLDCYDGKLATARKDIEDAVKDLQDQLEEDKANDEDLAGFREKLGKIDWGEKELEKIQIPDPVEEMRKVIVALQDCIAEIEKLKP